MSYLSPLRPGEIGESPKRSSRIRKCIFCNKKLNSYNLNPYCHAHVRQGVEILWAQEEAQRLESYRKQVEKIKRRKRERNSKNHNQDGQA